MLLPAMPADTQTVSWEGRSKEAHHVYPENCPKICHKQKTCFCGLDTPEYDMHQSMLGGTCFRNVYAGGSFTIQSAS